MDPQIANLKYREWPNLEYYPKLISNSLFVVGGLTSMIIESLIFWKKYIAIAYKDEFKRNQNYIFKTRPHLFDLENIDDVYLCKDRNQLENIFLNVFKEYEIIDKKKTDNQRNYLLYNDEKTFEERIVNKINQIIFSK